MKVKIYPISNGMKHLLLGASIVFVCALGAYGFAQAHEEDEDSASHAAADSTLHAEREAMMRELRGERTELQTQIKSDLRSFQTEAKTILRDLKDATPEERKDAMQDLHERREELRKQARELRDNLRDTAKERREAFREKFRDARESARVAAAHGKGLRMLNRFRAAIARFAHITERLESRMEKLEEEGVDISSIEPLIEEAENMQAQAEVKMEELKAKYEALLDGERVGGISQEARAIAETLKKETEDLHAQLKEISSALQALTPEESEEETEE